MARKQYEMETWYPDVVDYMIRHDANFSLACQAVGVKFTSHQEEVKHERRQSFIALYETEKNKFYARIGTNPDLSKDVLVGQGIKALQGLNEKGEYDKVASLLMSVAKIAGWLDEGTKVTVLGSLSQAERDELKQKVKALQQAPETDGKVN